MDLGRMPTYFHDADSGEELDQIDNHMPLAIGDGLIWHGGSERYRVVDRWVSFDHHGRFNDGLHIWLRKVTATAEDRPKLDAPDYFRD